MPKITSIIIGAISTSLFALPIQSGLATSSRAERLLIGQWAPPGGSCEGDTIEVYNVDGSYETDTSKGRWRIIGKTLTRRIELTGETGEKLLRLTRPDIFSVTIVRLDRNVRIERWPDKKSHRFLRCKLH
jgi:hypothetical protein